MPQLVKIRIFLSLNMMIYFQFVYGFFIPWVGNPRIILSFSLGGNADKYHHLILTQLSFAYVGIMACKRNVTGLIVVPLDDYLVTKNEVTINRKTS